MAEAALLSLASKVVSTVASPAFKKAYETACSIWGASDAVDKLTTSIGTIQAQIRDAEEQQEGKHAVVDLLKRLKEVLYDAEDLFDAVSTNALLKQQMEDMLLPLREVKVFFSKLNPVVSGYSSAKKVEAIRKNLSQISTDMAPFQFVHRVDNKMIRKRGKETNSNVDVKTIFGRDDDKEKILGFLYNDKYAEENISVIAIVGIGGMGKSTLAQLVYHNGNILNDFNGKRRWWVFISSDTVDQIDIARKIFHSITDRNPKGLSFEQLKSGIKESVGMIGKFLLVLDDLWCDNYTTWRTLLPLLSSDGAKGSKIIITTRSNSVAKAIKACETHDLKDLEPDASWEMFKTYAFTSIEQENDPTWRRLGKQIMEKCANVPLAIQSIASLLNRYDTKDEWESIISKDLSKIEAGAESIMPILKLSYDHLNPNLKHCFAYSSLFKKGSEFSEKDLIYLWIAQGYINPTSKGNLEREGRSYFKELLRRCFFEKVLVVDRYGHSIVKYKLHDLIHELAQLVAGAEISTFLTEGPLPQIEKNTRHVSVGCKIDESWVIPPAILLQADSIRSFIFLPRNDLGSLVLDKNVTKLRFLRALNLEGLNIKEIPSSIGKLKHIRYLNLSKNKGLHTLPNSITKLVNLLTLELSGCLSLQAFPNDFRKLISLRHLDITECNRLVLMPSKFGELTSLQILSDFKVSRGGGDDGKDNGLAPLAGLNLQGQLKISYDTDGGWSEDEMKLQHGQISETIEVLSIHHYPNVSIPTWWNTASEVKLTSLQLYSCKNVRHLPPLRLLPSLSELFLGYLTALEYVEKEDVVGSNEEFFPCLKLLEFTDLTKLVGWSPRNEAATTTTNEEHSVPTPEKSSFPDLSRLVIHNCPLLKLESMPSSPLLQELFIVEAREEMLQQLMSTCSLSSLQSIEIKHCSDVKTFQGKDLTSLRRLELRGWVELENVELAPGVVEDLTILRCPKLKLWDNGKEKTGVDWGSLAKLRVLCLDEIPKLEEELPIDLRQRKKDGKLQINQL